jgi:zinc/manganese transport system substrate-binding protein
MTKSRGSFLFFILVGILSILSGCNGQVQPNSSQSQGNIQNEKNQPITVVTAEDFYGEVARSVGGNYVKVESIINQPNIDPHDFEPTVNTAKSVSQAQVVVYNGIGYDNWMDKLVASSTTPKAKTVIRVGEDLLQKHQGDNEHLWYIPSTMNVLAMDLAKEYSKMDPTHAKDFQSNALNYQESLKPLQDRVKQLKQPTSQYVDTTEPVFDYMLQALNYKPFDEKFSLSLEEGADPSPADLAKMQNALKDRKVKYLVENVQVESPIVQQLAQLAKQNNVPIIKVSETMPIGKSYGQWMMDQLKQIRVNQPK